MGGVFVQIFGMLNLKEDSRIECFGGQRFSVLFDLVGYLCTVDVFSKIEEKYAGRDFSLY